MLNINSQKQLESFLQSPSKTENICIKNVPVQNINNFPVHIQELTISKCQLSCLNGIQELKGLNYLDLSFNQIRDIDLLKYMSQITKLRLNNNKIVDITTLSTHNMLIVLDLSKNSIKDFSPICQHTNYNLYILDEQEDSQEFSEILQIEYNQQTQNYELLTKRQQKDNVLCLQYVELNYNMQPKQTEEYYQQLKPLKNTATLYEDVELQKQDIQKYLKQISESNSQIQFTKIDSISLPLSQQFDINYLKHFPSVTYVNLEDNSITNIDVFSQLSKVTILILANNTIRNIAPLGKSNQLEHLNLSQNVITDISPLASLKLISLNLDKNYIINFEYIINHINFERYSLKDQRTFNKESSNEEQSQESCVQKSRNYKSFLQSSFSKDIDMSVLIDNYDLIKDEDLDLDYWQAQYDQYEQDYQDEILQQYLIEIQVDQNLSQYFDAEDSIDSLVLEAMKQDYQEYLKEVENAFMEYPQQ
ncbi:Conserved_hypothetical protein [Hexamita inflata]|uniref:Leucine-rich repeat protein n=1 Tax=Hexamita inflata TaxID=28002 RepID=A0AA86UC79_9EUKA|nr:Conserved hypothetical protein [Hexamita inflata]